MFVFTDGKDLKGIQKTKDIKYMKVLRYSLRVLTAWPEKEIELEESKYHVYKKVYTFFIEMLCLLPGILFLKMNFNKVTFFELGHTYITVFMNIVAVTRLVLIFQTKYYDTFEFFVNVIHLFNYKDKSDYAMKVHLLVHKMSHFLTIFSNIQMVIAIILFNCTPVYNNIRSGAYSNYDSGNITFEHAVYYALPFDFQHNFNGYLVVFFFNWYISYICTSCVCIFDMLMSLMVFHVWGHLKILLNNLENFPRPRLEEDIDKYFIVYSEQETKQCYQILRDNIRHHCLIKKFVKKMSKTFGPLLFVYFLFQQATGCLILLECSQMDTPSLMRYGPMALIFFQLVVQISVVFELLGALSVDLTNAVYNIPWECMDKSNRKILNVFLQQSQKSMNLKAMDMVPVGVQTMTMVIKTSLSYFVMLRTVAGSEKETY